LRGVEGGGVNEDEAGVVMGWVWGCFVLFGERESNGADWRIILAL